MKKEEPVYKLHPLMSWDISSTIYWWKSRKIKDLNHLKLFNDEFNWDIFIDKELAHNYEALILTDAKQIILWVNDGFQSMSGYPPSFAIGKKPSFLQGENTSGISRKRIRKKLEQGVRFHETIINQRKNGDEYDCHISIIPLRSAKNHQITHFLALEYKSA